MDINPQTAKPISDDQELAKVLAGVNQQNDEPLQFDTPPATPPSTSNPQGLAPAAEPAASADSTPSLPSPGVTPTSNTPPVSPSTPPLIPSDNLDNIKKDALNELRPLVDKLDLPPEEKFDTYLLLIRSTDDKALIAPAHAAAQSIIDETRKAQALLDIIKEIDYLSGPQQS